MSPLAPSPQSEPEAPTRIIELNPPLDIVTGTGGRCRAEKLEIAPEGWRVYGPYEYMPPSWWKVGNLRLNSTSMEAITKEGWLTWA